MKVLSSFSIFSASSAFLLSVLMAACLCDLPGNFQPARSTLERADRLLQTSYAIKPSADIKIHCDDSGVKAADLAISLAMRDEEAKKIAGRYSGIVDSFNSAGGDPSTLAKSAINALGASIAFAALSFLSFQFLFFWSLCECCCKKTCCVKEQAENEGRGKGRIICWILGALVGIAVTVMTIVWVAQLGSVAGRVKDIKCGIAILYSDLVFGTHLEGGGKFIGLNGLDSMLGEYITLIDSISSIKSDATTVKNQNLDTKSTTMETQYNSFKTSFNPSTYTFKGTTTPATMVTLNIAAGIKAAADGPLAEEVSALKKAATSIHNAVIQIEGFDTSSIESAKKTLTDIRNSIGKDLRKPLNDLYTLIVSGGTDYSKSVQSASKAMMAVSIVIIVGFTVIYLVILFCTAKLNKCYGLKCLQKIIMLIQLLVGFIILLFTVIGTILSVVFAVACSVMDGAITTENYLTTKGIAKDSPELNKMMNECVFRNGKGDLMKALGGQTSTFDQLNGITDGMQAFKDISANLSSQSTPILGGGLHNSLLSYINFSAVDRGTPQAEDIQTGIDAFNNHGCAMDIMRANDVPSTYLGSSTGDSTTINMTPTPSKYCIKLSSFPTHKYVGRYSTPPTCASGTPAQAEAVLTKTLDSTTDYLAKMTNCRTFYEGNFYTSESAVFSSLKVAVPQLTNILNKVDSALIALKAIDGTFKSVADCTVFRKEILLIENIFCFRFGNDVYQQNQVAIALGAMLFFYSWCMCCGIRLSNKQEGQKDNQVQPENYDPVNDKSVANAQDNSAIVNDANPTPPVPQARGRNYIGGGAPNRGALGKKVVSKPVANAANNYI